MLLLICSASHELTRRWNIHTRIVISAIYCICLSSLIYLLLPFLLLKRGQSIANWAISSIRTHPVRKSREQDFRISKLSLKKWYNFWRMWRLKSILSVVYLVINISKGLFNVLKVTNAMLNYRFGIYNYNPWIMLLIMKSVLLLGTASFLSFLQVFWEKY